MILSALLTLLAGACYTDGGTIIECPGSDAGAYASALCRAAPMAAVTDGGTCYGIGTPPDSLGCPAAAGSYIAALTTSCVTHACPTCLTGLVAYYAFEPLSDGGVPDVSGNGHDSTTVNGITWDAGIIGLGVASINPALSTNIQFIPNVTISGGSGDFAISAWVKVVSAQPAGTWGTIACETTSEGLFLAGTSGKWSWYLGGDHLSTNAASVGSWHHVVVNGTSAGVAYYVNGVSDGSASFAVGTFLLASLDACGGGNVMRGVLDETALFNRNLTTDEIATLYNSGAGLAYTAW